MLLKYMRKKRRNKGIDLAQALKILWVTDTHIDASVDGDSEAEGACSEWEDSVVGPRCYYTGRGKLAYFVDQVNIANPDMAIHTGDSIDGEHSDVDFQLFLDEWNRIDPGIHKEFARGNHDRNPNLIPMLGYDGKPVNAGSVFNQSYTLSNEQNTVRIITINTHLQEDIEDGYTGRTQGRAYQYLLDWIENEIVECPEDTVLIFSHAGPHQPNSYFQDEHGVAFRNMVYASRGNKNVYSLFGHRHSGITGYTTYNSVPGLGSMVFRGHTIPAAVNQGEQSNYGLLYVTRDGQIVGETKDLLYTP